MMKLCEKFNHWQENEDKKKEYCKEQFDSCSFRVVLVVDPLQGKC